MKPFRTKSGKWKAKFSWYDKQKQRHYTSKTFVSKVDAENWLTVKKMDKMQGKTEKATTFLWVFDHYFDTYKKGFVKENTRFGWMLTRNAYLDFFLKETTVQSITSDSYQKFLNDYSKRHAHSTVRGVNNRLSEVFNYAIQEGYINRSPAALAKIGGKPPKKIVYLNISQIKAVLTYVINKTDFERRIDTDKPTGVPYAIAAAILTGCRESELAGLTWDHVDFAHKTITIDRQWSTATNTKTTGFTSLKTSASYRTIPVSDNFFKMIEKIKQPGDYFVFNSRYNNPLQAATLSKYLKGLLKKLDIDAPGFHFHSLRHSHVALLMANDVDLFTISKRLGHSSYKETADTYAYLIEERKNKDNKKIISALNSLT
ncbi:tyrosine-type recombinase/integrase [Limosilactobacillus antri]|uniref:tyrosine-type recombinase/integrase n=1 Tax=Limosilactobacillus antri TaxID=227943 RepID=UPI001F56C534|nr:site-specific integrase [Limosilactobacillus antri]